MTRRLRPIGVDALDLERGGWAGALTGKEIRPPDHAAAFALLRRLGTDPANMVVLREALADEIGASMLFQRSDLEVIDRLASLLSTGQIRLWPTPPEVLASAPVPKPPEPKPKPPVDEKHEVEFEITDQFGDPISGLLWVLTHPSGKKETGTLGADGRVQRSDVQPGNYRLELKLVTRAAWGADKVLVGSEVKLRAEVSGYDPGTSGKFEIFDACGLHEKAIATIDAQVSPDRKLEAAWTPKKDDLEDADCGYLVFVATVGDTHAASSPIPVLSKHEFELEGPDGPLPDTKLLVRFSGGTEVGASSKGGKVEAWARIDEHVLWVDLPDHPGAHVVFESESGDTREYRVPDRASA